MVWFEVVWFEVVWFEGSHDGQFRSNPFHSTNHPTNTFHSPNQFRSIHLQSHNTLDLGSMGHRSSTGHKNIRRHRKMLGQGSMDRHNIQGLVHRDLG